MRRPASYNVTSYGDMITDAARMNPYAQALAATVRPGCTVLDIGAGTGIFSLLACKLGASRVHAVEPADAIDVARAMAAANGVADRITFHHALSSAVKLSEPADVMVSDLRGVLPLFQHHIPAIVDARSRLLASGGALIPRRDTLWAALVNDERSYRRYAEPWLTNAFDLDLRAGHGLAINSWRKINAKADQLLTPAQHWATLDYATIASPHVAGEVAWTAEREGTAHGLLIWFDTELADGIGFSNAPGGPELIYGQAFFPFQAPIALAPGDNVTVALRANLVADDYVWQWNARVDANDGTARPRVRYHQSTFLAQPLSAGALAKREAGFRPTLGDEGRLDSFVLTSMNGETTLEEIAARCMTAFAGRFNSVNAALAYVGGLSVKYGRD